MKVNGHHAPVVDGVIVAGAADDARALAALVAAFDAWELRPAGSPAPCPYERHRQSDWRAVEGGPVTCGRCHPPAVPAIPIVDETR